MTALKIGELEIRWLGHAGFLIKYGARNIYLDPFKLKPEDIKKDYKADMILLTHDHYDHCSIEDLRKIATKNTTIVAVAECQSKLEKLDFGEEKIMKPGDKIEIDGIRIEAVPAYNSIKEFHPKSNEWVGYIVEISGIRIYHAGDTDLIPEMKKIKADIALLPVGGKYTMGAEEAAKAVEWIKPKIAVPMHYGGLISQRGLIGDKSNAETFKRLAKTKVEILG